ncbi:MAG: YabP/YqfC family sporulation protein [Clostridiales bacterium]|nr:YabP/YqfC family sporulation protein [Clostridiales bacterium]
MCGIFMGREQEREHIREKLASAASMPKDVVLGASVITVLGTCEVCIENYRGILEYTENLIRVQTKERLIKLSGKHLQIEYYTNDEMKITGRIEALEFGDRRTES